MYVCIRIYTYPSQFHVYYGAACGEDMATCCVLRFSTTVVCVSMEGFPTRNPSNVTPMSKHATKLKRHAA